MFTILCITTLRNWKDSLCSLRFKMVNEEQSIHDSMLRDIERSGRVVGGRDTA